MPSSSTVALAVAARLKKVLPLQTKAAKALLLDINLAIGQVKRADVRSCMSAWGRLNELAIQVKQIEVQQNFNKSFDDGEVLAAEGRDFAGARELLLQLKKLADVLDAIHGALKDLEKEASFLSGKAGLLVKVMSEIKGKKDESAIMKKFDAGTSGLGLLVSLILVYKKLSGKKVTLR